MNVFTFTSSVTLFKKLLLAQGDHVDTLDCRRWEALLYRWADTCDADRPTTHKTALPRGIIQREMSVVASLRNPD